MERAFQTFTQIAAELREEGLDASNFLQNDAQARFSTGNRRKKGCGTGAESVLGRIDF